jgi:hypothetical protein
MAKKANMTEPRGAAEGSPNRNGVPSQSIPGTGFCHDKEILRKNQDVRRERPAPAPGTSCRNAIPDGFRAPAASARVIYYRRGDWAKDEQSLALSGKRTREIRTSRERLAAPAEDPGPEKTSLPRFAARQRDKPAKIASNSLAF